LPALLGGAGISLAAHELLLLTGDTLGISGFIHRSLKGNIEGLAGLAGLIVGGVLVATLEDGNNIPSPLNASPACLLLSGFLVGLGTKLANGCTSGHMICGISRLALRSTVATTIFVATASLTANIIYGNVLTSVISPSSSWLLTSWERTDIFLQATLFLAVSAFYTLIPKFDLSVPSIHRLRLVTYFTIAVQFGLALRLSDLTEPRRVLGFLLPFRKGFDPSLLFVAISSIPLGIILFRVVSGIGNRRNEKGTGAVVPTLGTEWSWNNDNSGIDQNLILGSAIFGFGWGLSGICPGTGVVNIGRALAHGQILSPFTLWTSAVAAGGFAAEKLQSTIIESTVSVNESTLLQPGNCL